MSGNQRQRFKPTTSIQGKKKEKKEYAILFQQFIPDVIFFYSLSRRHISHDSQITKVRTVALE